MLPASFTLLNHLKPCHTNIAMCPCWWLHRSEGQMISQLHYYPVCAYKQAQLKWYSNKVEQNVYRRKIIRENLFTSSLICASCSCSTAGLFSDMWQIKIKNIFPCIASSKKSVDSSSSRNASCSYIIPNERFLKTCSKLLNSVLQGTQSTCFPVHCIFKTTFLPVQYPLKEPITTSSVAPCCYQCLWVVHCKVYEWFFHLQTLLAMQKDTAWQSRMGSPGVLMLVAPSGYPSLNQLLPSSPQLRISHNYRLLY